MVYNIVVGFCRIRFVQFSHTELERLLELPIQFEYYAAAASS